MEIEGRWHLFARSTVRLYSSAGKVRRIRSVPLQIFVANRTSGAANIIFAAVQSPRKVRTFAEGLRGDRAFLESVRSVLRKAGASNVEALGFSDDSDVGTESSMILEGAVTLPPAWERLIAPLPRVRPTVKDPDRLTIGQKLDFAELISLVGESESTFSDRWAKVADFRATLKKSGTLKLNVFASLNAVRNSTWQTLILVFKSSDPEATLRLLSDHADEVVAQAGATFRKAGIEGTSSLRFHPTPGVLNAFTLAWTGTAFSNSALERFAKPLGVDTAKLRKYRQEIEGLLHTAREVCGPGASEGPRPFLVTGAADCAKVVPRLQELGWTRHGSRSGKSPDRGYHYFQQGGRKLTVNLGTGASPIYFEAGWREPFAVWRNAPYLKS
jgi:hypothetical protein